MQSVGWLGVYSLFFFQAAREVALVYSEFFIEMVSIEVVFGSGFFHRGVPACFSVQVHDTVGVGNAHPAALKMKLKSMNDEK